MRSHTHTRPLTLRRALVAFAALTVIASAFGSADDDDAQADGVASLRDASGDDTATTDATATADATATSDNSGEESSELEAPEDPEEAFALYDQCLQDHGVDPGQGFV